MVFGSWGWEERALDTWGSGSEETGQATVQRKEGGKAKGSLQTGAQGREWCLLKDRENQGF